MAHYEMQILLGDGRGLRSWHSVRPTGGTPYKYDTEREASNMLDTCYPGLAHRDEKRVLFVEE